MADQPNPYATWERNFIQQVKRLRESREMTQTDLAKALRPYGLPFHQQTVQRIENGERPVRLNEAHAIAEVLQVDLSAMVATDTSLDHELFFSVERLRRSSGEAEYRISVAIVQWLDDVSSFFDILSQRIDRAKPQTVEQLDPVTRWGLAWAFKVGRASSMLIPGVIALSQVKEGRPFNNEDEDYALILLVNNVDRTLRRWQEQFHSSELESESSMPARELLKRFPGDPDLVAEPPF